MTVLVFTFAGCGQSGGEVADSPTGPASAVVQNEAPLILSDDLGQSEYVDAGTGQSASLGEVVTGDRAVLLWYWRPDCETSRRDAAAVAQFARDHQNTIQVIGIGAQGEFDDVREFLDDTAVQMTLLWEPSGHTWQLNEVHASSSIQLFSPDLSEQSDLLHFDERGRQIVLDAAPQPRWSLDA